MVRFTLNILNFMNLLLVASPLLSRTKSVGTGGHTADEGVGGLKLLLKGGGDLGVLLLHMRLEEPRGNKGPGDSLLPAGVAEVLLHLVLDSFDALVDSSLVALEIPDQGEAEGTQPTLVWLLQEMDGGLVLGQIGSLAEAQATGGTLNNISIITLFTLN